MILITVAKAFYQARCHGHATVDPTPLFLGSLKGHVHVLTPVGHARWPVAPGFDKTRLSRRPGDI